MARLLTEVCQIQYGFPFDSARFTTSDGIPLIRIRDVVRGYSETYTTEECDASYIVNDGDMLVGMDGEFNIARWKGGKAYLNQRVCRLIPKADICPEYLFHFMPGALKRIEDQTPFATVKHLSAKQLNAISVPLPSLEEQRHIANQLEAADTLISLRKQQIAKLDELVKARFVELTEATNANPTRMGDIATYINGYAFKPTQWEESGLPIIRIQNLNDHNAPYNYYSGELAAKYLIRNGDVLVSWATHLEAYVWNGQEAWLNQHIFKVVFDKMEVNKIYYVYACEEALRQAFRNAHGFKPTMEHIKKADFDDAIVKLPDMHTQDRFAAFVEQTDKSKLVIQQSLAQLETLKKALMQKYFG